QEQRHVQVHRDRELLLERRALRRPRRQVAKIIETGFAHRDHFRFAREVAQKRIRFGTVTARMMRMHARRRVQDAGMFAYKFQRMRAALARRTGDDHSFHAGLARALQHRIEVAAEGLVGEVGTDIDQLHGYSTKRVPRSVASGRSDGTKRPTQGPAQGVERCARDQYVPSARTTTRRLDARHAISVARFLSSQALTGSTSPRVSPVLTVLPRTHAAFLYGQHPW